MQFHDNVDLLHKRIKTLFETDGLEYGIPVPQNMDKVREREAEPSAEQMGDLYKFRETLTGTLIDIVALNREQSIHGFRARLRNYLDAIQSKIEKEYSQKNLKYFFDFTKDNIQSLLDFRYEESYSKLFFMHLTSNLKCPHVHGMQVPLPISDANHHYISSPPHNNLQVTKTKNGENWYMTTDFPFMGLQMFLYLILVKGIRRFISFATIDHDAAPFYLASSMMYQRTFSDVCILLPMYRLEIITMPCLDFCPPELNDAIKILELSFYDNTETAMSCSAGFGRTGTYMLMIGLYEDCLSSGGATLANFSLHKETDDLEAYVDSFYPNNYDFEDSPAKELVKLISVARVVGYARRINTVLYACALVYIKHVNPSYRFTLGLFEIDDSTQLKDMNIKNVNVDNSTPLRNQQGELFGGARNKMPNFAKMNLEELNTFLFGNKIPAAMTQDVQTLRAIGYELYRNDLVFGISMDKFDFYSFMGSKRPNYVIQALPTGKAPNLLTQYRENPISYTPSTTAAAAGGYRKTHDR